MGTMKAAVLYGDRDLRITDIPKPQAPDNGVWDTPRSWWMSAWP